jgi:hypothetical protein
MTTLEKTRHLRPDIAITVSWEFDPSFDWDGDMEDPALDPDNPLFPHDVTVTASIIRRGLLIQDSVYLGGCYAPPGGPYDEEVDGYLPQLIDDAIQFLDLKLKETIIQP